MKHLAVPMGLLLITSVLGSGSAHSQARGPSAKETIKNGQDVGGRNIGEKLFIQGEAKKAPIPESVVKKGPEAVRSYLSALPPIQVLDDATRTERLAALETWLRRLPGRFRIDGRIAMPATVPRYSAPTGTFSIETVLSARISGVADCTAVGKGPGVQCFINATWPHLESDVKDFKAPDQALNISDAVNTLQPAMLVLGLDLDQPAVRAHMVTDESIATVWIGGLDGNTLRTTNKSDCKPFVDGVREYRCNADLNIIAEPESESVTIDLVWRVLMAAWDPAYRMESVAPGYDERKAPLRDLHVKLIMYRDAAAAAEGPSSTKKMR